jgi:GntR family transcriptional regulator/MocR family aminotransferase
MLPWKSIIKIDKHLRRPIYLQIVDSIVSKVMQAKILVGERMPSSRSLANDLQINRKTVLQAYDELMAQGWIELLPSKGTFIKKTLPQIESQPLSDTVELTASSTATVSDIYKKPKLHTNVIDDGSPDYRLAPIDLLLKTARSIAHGAIGKTVLIGNHVLGEITLRKNLSSYLMSTRAISGSVDNLMITRGSQMAIYLALDFILDSDDRIAVGELNYESADLAIESIGAKKITIKVTPEGIDIDHLEQLINKEKIKAIYVTPHHHYPTTVTMPVEKRIRLLELANTHDFYIIEDDYDYDYHYSKSPILPLASIDQQTRVIYIGSFSKILVPSVRIGYMHAHTSIIQACGKKRMVIDKMGDPIIERALAELLKDNEIDRYLKKAIRKYEKRRDLFCKILKNGLSNMITFDIPKGGMAIWVNLGEIKVNNLIKLAETNHLTLNIHKYEHAKNKCRLGFASMNETEIFENTRILVATIQQLSL